MQLLRGGIMKWLARFEHASVRAEDREGALSVSSKTFPEGARPLHRYVGGAVVSAGTYGAKRVHAVVQRGGRQASSRGRHTSGSMPSPSAPSFSRPREQESEWRRNPFRSPPSSSTFDSDLNDKNGDDGDDHGGDREGHASLRVPNGGPELLREGSGSDHWRDWDDRCDRHCPDRHGGSGRGTDPMGPLSRPNSRSDSLASSAATGVALSAPHKTATSATSTSSSCLFFISSDSELSADTG